MLSFQLICGHCGWQTVCGVDDAITRLRLVGMLRREPNPDEAIVATLLVEGAPQMTCPLCKEKRLRANPTEEDETDDWQAAVLCEVCREPIDPERLGVIPGTKRCATCQGKSESGQLDELEPDYCPHCGSLVEVRASCGGGITRYKRVCTGDPPCRL